MLQIKSGQKKSDDTTVTKEEEDQFNDNLPDFFSAEYETQQLRKFQKHLFVGIFSSGFFMGLTIKTYQSRVSGGVSVMSPFFTLLGLGIMMGTGLRMAQRSNSNE